MSAIREALRERTVQSSAASRQFDFVQEGSLATFWRQATPGTAYWRGYLPMKHLPGQMHELRADSVEMPGDELILHGQEGAAIWQFLGDNARDRIALQMQRQGTRTLMEVDDNYLRFAPPLYGKHGAWTRTHAEAAANGTGYSVEMHRNVVPLMDGIIAATANLAEEYGEYNDNVYHCPNSIDPDDWNVERVESDVLRIGYYGSPSHMRDWPLVKKALKWASKQRDVEVVLIGFAPPAWSGHVLPWADSLFAARQNLGRIDVGIAPLTINQWSVGKSDVKALEYAMAGVMPILQDAEPYAPWRSFWSPWMPSTAAEWDDAIRDVVATRDDVKTLAAVAKKYVLEYRTIQGNIDSWRRAVNGT